MTLEERRQEWEEGMEPLLVLPYEGFKVYVIAKTEHDQHNRYWLLRYWDLFGDWVVSADVSNGTIEACLKVIQQHTKSDYKKLLGK